jgi:hypothetical protein
MDEHKNSLPKNPNSFFNKIHINMGDTSTTTTNNINASRVDASNNSGSIGAIDSSQTIQENAKVRLI